MSEKSVDILFAGVGGQGVLLGAEITALAAVHSGFEIGRAHV